MSGVEPSGHVLGSASHPVVVVERDLRATPEEVWSAWTDPERAVRWLGALEAPLVEPGVPLRLAMAGTELPDEPSTAENAVTFTVQEAVPPQPGRDGRLVFTFDDLSDPGGLVTVTMTAVGDDRCRLVLRHAQHPSGRAIETTAGLGAGWEGFFDWLEDALAGRDHDVDRYELALPYYDARVARLRKVSRGTVEDGAVRQTRLIGASREEIWGLLTTPAGLARWLGRVVEGRLEPGGDVVVVHDESAPEIRQSSVVTEWEPPRRLAMTWDYTGEPASSLELTLHPEGDQTRLELIHRGVADLADDYRVGWHAHLDLLVAEAEGWGRPPWAEALDAARASG